MREFKVNGIVLDERGSAAWGTYNTVKRNPRIVFSVITNKIIYWAEYGLDYAGG